jgi:hypothetical protein
MIRPLLSTFVCCWLAASTLHVANDVPPAVQQRVGELIARREAALYGDDDPQRGKYNHKLKTFWGCDELPFRMAMPAHSATCTVTSALVKTLEEAGIDCKHNGKPDAKAAGQDHDHNGLAQSYIDQGLWNTFNSTVSWVMAKDPWSRIVSAASWLKGFNASSERHQQIRDFRKFVRENLPANTTPSGNHVFKYLHSISEFAYAVPPFTSEEVQVVTYVGRVKDLSGSFKHVCSILGVEQKNCVDPNDSRVRQHWETHGGTGTGPQNWERGGTRPSTVDLFDDELRERVAQIWAKDIERFGFVFGEL